MAGLKNKNDEPQRDKLKMGMEKNEGMMEAQREKVENDRLPKKRWNRLEQE